MSSRLRGSRRGGPRQALGGGFYGDTQRGRIGEGDEGMVARAFGARATGKGLEEVNVPGGLVGDEGVETISHDLHRCDSSHVGLEVEPDVVVQRGQK